ncbi:MAG: ATP-binding protein [Ignavibacteriae bacterium]|nr:MAG: ATP-binding protein [Ignavibacteriota bacterium]
MKKKNTKKNNIRKAAPLHKPLDVKRLRWQCDPKSLGIKSTNDLQPTREIIGQERALRALRVGLEMEHYGYNIFVTGFSGTGRTTTIKRLLQDFEKKQGQLKDHCYVYNFKNPDTPIAISLPSGQGRGLKQDMENFIKELLRDIPAVYESQRYQQSRKKLVVHFQERQKSVLKDFERRVKERGFDLVQVQTGNTMRPDIVPVVNGAPMGLDQIETLVQKNEFSKEQFDTMRDVLTDLEKQMATVFRELRNIENKVQESLRELEEQLVMPAVDEAMGVLNAIYDHPKLRVYFEDVRSNIRNNLERFRRQQITFPSQNSPQEEGGEELKEEDKFLEFQVNVLVDNSDTQQVSIVIETNPKYKNIFGIVERDIERGGVWRTDFTRIKAGSLLRADGGYLVLNALDVLMEPGVWQDLKRTLRTGLMDIQTYEPLFGFSAASLKPEPIEINVKVIMIGETDLYNLLYARDEDFKKIFKIRADFDFEMPKTKGSVAQYMRFIKMICDDEKLLPFSSSALAQIIEFGVRLAGRKQKISTRFNIIADVAREASYWAKKGKSEAVLAPHIEQALEERLYRVKLVEEKIQEMIHNGAIMIDTDGAQVGQVNGLSVYDLGEHEFGKPSRITARTSLGRNGIINIEREAELSGPTHNKGVAILSGYFRSTFAQNKPLVMDASITFEQSYGGIDGDSASSTEIYAILSSLSEVPIRQGIAVTGSVNQKGEIQPIGGVNLKIEGFYDVCKARGFTGTQGVMIPVQNIDDLMLREEIYEAVQKKKFSIYAVTSIDEGIEILTGLKAGKKNPDNTFEPGTLNAMVDGKLRRYADDWKKYEGRN